MLITMGSALNINILLVDDHPENLLVLEAILESPAYHIVKALSGEEALRCLLNQPISLILLDVQMPGLNGFSTARLIKERESTQHIPIIFMSAIHKAYEYVLKGYSAGGVDYLFTPFDPEIVRAKVTALVELFNRESQPKHLVDILHLNERRHRYRSLAEALPIIVWTASPDGPIDHINKEWRNYTGMTFDQSKGWRWAAALHPDDLQYCLDRLTRAIRVVKDCDIECRLKRKDGSYRWHRLRTAPERNLKGKLMGWFGNAIDIHEQRQVEETERKKTKRSS